MGFIQKDTDCFDGAQIRLQTKAAPFNACRMAPNNGRPYATGKNNVYASLRLGALDEHPERL